METDLRKGSELVDLETGKVTPFQVIADLPAYPTGPGEPSFERVRFAAEDVPAVGYRAYTIRQEALSARPGPEGANRFKARKQLLPRRS